MDFAALSTALVTEIGGVMTDAQPVILLVLTIVVGWGIYRKFIKAK